MEEPSTPRRGRSRSPDQADVQHADILGHVDQLKHAGPLTRPILQPADMLQAPSATGIHLPRTLWRDTTYVVLAVLRPVSALRLPLMSSRHATLKYEPRKVNMQLHCMRLWNGAVGYGQLRHATDLICHCLQRLTKRC